MMAAGAATVEEMRGALAKTLKALEPFIQPLIVKSRLKGNGNALTMASEAPPFWWEPPDWRAYALYPLSRIYGFVATRRMTNARREKIDVPVLCVGNFTVGGTGKTPVAIALAKQAKAHAADARLPVARPWRQLRRAACRRPHARQRPACRRRAAAAGRACAPATTPNRAAGAKLLMRARLRSS